MMSGSSLKWQLNIHDTFDNFSSFIKSFFLFEQDARKVLVCVGSSHDDDDDNDNDEPLPHSQLFLSI